MPTTQNKRALSEIETAEYIGMSRSFLRQSRMEGNRENRIPAPPFIKISCIGIVNLAFIIRNTFRDLP